ncbi:MAG: DedA family protein [Burkholderiales bacterium]|nr:MAG: DedA family protein [Burkholderiales bacterium]TAG81240.1 MAG: DedA family protein [Betaproteobacteria bacterium]
MEFITDVIQFFSMLDDRLLAMAQANAWTFVGVVALIIFVETGVVVMPFLPGDSLLFVSGAVAAVTDVNVHVFALILIVAAVLGDAVNYTIGRRVGLKLFANPDSKIFRQEYLAKTQAFYDKYGAFSIVMGRFVPIVRTFVPFLAGVARMPYSKFFFYNVTGGIFWVGSLMYAGYFLGNLPWAKENLSIIVIGIVIASVMPMVIKYWQEKRAATQASSH